MRCLVRFLKKGVWGFLGGRLRRFSGGGFWRGVVCEVFGEVFGEVFEKGFWAVFKEGGC